MSDRVFPSLPGVIQVGREPFFVTRQHESESGARIAIRKRTSPGYAYTLEVRGLREWLGETDVLFSFFEDHCGAYESFLYVDRKDGITRRVHFVDDRLPLKRQNNPSGGYYTGEVALETVVVPEVSMPHAVQTFTTATRPTPSATWVGTLIYVKDNGSAGVYQGCRQKADGTYEWVAV